MRLEKHKGDSVDLSQEEKKSKWAMEIVKNINIKIPIMTAIPKNAKSAHLNFLALSRHVSLAESLIFKSKRFKTTSEVYRAALYLGMSILYQLTKDEGTLEQKARAGQIYKEIEVMDSLNHNRQSIDAVVWAAKDLIDCADSGVIDYEEMAEKTSMLVNALPKELRPIARKKIKRIMKGDNVVDIMETKVQRGTKATRKRNV